MKQRRCLLAVLLVITCWTGSASAMPITVNGLEWLQPVDFVNLSWNDISATCDPTTGACNGLLGTTDVTGYTWASVDDVNNLFNYYINNPFTFLGPGPDYIASYFAEAWANAFFANGWLATLGSNAEGYTGLQATVRDTAFEDGVTVARKGLIVNNFDVYSSDLVSTNQGVPVDTRYSSIGVWAYRDSPTVPTPATISLLCLGLSALRFSRRKRKKLHN